MRLHQTSNQDVSPCSDHLIRLRDFIRHPSHISPYRTIVASIVRIWTGLDGENERGTKRRTVQFLPFHFSAISSTMSHRRYALLCTLEHDQSETPSTLLRMPPSQCNESPRLCKPASRLDRQFCIFVASSPSSASASSLPLVSIVHLLPIYLPTYLPTRLASSLNPPWHGIPSSTSPCPSFPIPPVPVSLLTPLPLHRPAASQPPGNPSIQPPQLHLTPHYPGPQISNLRPNCMESPYPFPCLFPSHRSLCLYI